MELIERLSARLQALGHLYPQEPTKPYRDRYGHWCIADVVADGQTALTTLQSDKERMEAEIARLREALASEREENLWNAYNSGAVKNGRWTHMFMSDGEWLARQCGCDPKLYDYDDAEIRAAIPKAARARTTTDEATGRE